jgi:hypothetical protein
MRPGQTVHSRVVTSLDVTYVEARINYRNQAMRKDSPGHFSLDYTIPWWLPPWLRHPYTLQIVARAFDGTEVKRDLPISLH